jgi:PAS domain S-box-containing protein
LADFAFKRSRDNDGERHRRFVIGGCGVEGVAERACKPGADVKGNNMDEMSRDPSRVTQPGSGNIASSGSAKSWLRRPRPAHHFLLAFAVALVLPVLLLAALLAFKYVDSEQVRAIETARSSARELLVAVERELVGPEMALRVLGTEPSVRSGDLKTFYQRAKAAADALGVTITVHKPGDKFQSLDTSVAWGAPVQSGNSEISIYEEQAIRTRQTTVTGVIAEPTRHIPVVFVLTPVFDGDKPLFVIAIAIPANHFVEALHQVSLPPAWISAFVDSNGRIIARSAGQSEFAGQPASSSWYQSAISSSAPWMRDTLDGQNVLVNRARSTRTGWTAAIAVPTGVLDAPLWRSFWLLVASGAGLLAIASFLAFWSGVRLSNAIRSLKVAGLRYSDQHLNSIVDTPVSEINEVGAAMAEAISHGDRREAQLDSILATVPSSMVIIDDRGYIQAFSRSAEKLFGYVAAEVVGSNVSVLMPEPDRSAHDGYIERFERTGEKKIIGIGRLVTGLRKNGEKFPLELHVGEAAFDGKKLFTGFMRDQTEKQRIEQELRQTQKMEAIGKLTGGVAHDFNNLLTVIKGNLEMLEDFIGDSERDLLRDSQEAADLAAQLTASLLAFGRRMPLNPRRLDVGELLTSTSDLLRRTLGETIEVTTSIKKVSDTIVDGPQLQNALLNLAINARDAMPRGGKLSIAVSDVELDEDYAESYGDVTPGRYVMIAMTDTGTGMTKQVRERAFEPFFTTKPQGSGTGLGLSSVYGFVKQSGGHIALYSEDGKGTTVRLYLPCLMDGKSKAQVLPSSREALPKGNGRVVLVVEDDNLVRRVTVARLKSLGYEVIEAADGPSGVELLEKRSDVELLFTDMVMPGGMTGADLAGLAKLSRPELKILFTSGYAEPELVRETDSPSEQWLKKPYTVAELAHRIHAVLGE